MGARLGTRQPHRNPDASNLSVPIVIIRDERSHLRIFDRNFFRAWPDGKNFIQLLISYVAAKRFDFPLLNFLQVLFHTLHHTIESNFSGVGDKRKNRVP